MGRRSGRKAEGVRARTCLQVILEAAGFFGVVELLSHTLDIVSLFVYDCLHPLTLQRVVGGAGRDGTKEVSLLAETVFIVASLLLCPRFFVRDDGELGGGFGRRPSLLLLLASALLLRVKGVQVLALLLDPTKFFLLFRHFFLSRLLLLFLSFAFPAKFLRLLSRLARACFFLGRHQREYRRLGDGSRGRVCIGGLVAAGSSSSRCASRRGLG